EIQSPSDGTVGSTSVPDPDTLTALIKQNETGLEHEMILKSHSNTGEATSSYPKRPSITLQNGFPITLESDNPDFTITPTEVILYDKNDVPVYLKSEGGNNWMLDVPTGTYKLEVKTEYTPSNDDVATFIDTVRVKEGDVNANNLVDKNEFATDLEKLFDRK
ncbi:MAG TPA: hypothetical protein VL854_14010, partial [Nitrososphaeraceae archaeon]|nr:hypothetical protein [Nitrososphaeraceae archaeon]